ncbi:hypothetical protein ACNI3T_05395 [Christiangramia sp. ASW11-125]|uniref:hypothetical protein n=1 Tax=Christiangramia sp. ASW11-125 TaxID=3400701 RepID=UPI003AAFF908
MNYQISEPSILKKIIKIDQEKRLIADQSTQHLTRWLNQDGFFLDKEAAQAYLENNFKEGTKAYHKRSSFIMNFEFYVLKYSRNGKDDRLHSIFTRMPSDLKQFVQFEGRKLIEVDITNSQPLFLVLLLKEIRLSFDNYEKNNLTIEDVKKKVRKIINGYINNRYRCEYYTNIDKYRIDTNKLSNNISTILSRSSEPIDFTDVLQFEKLVKEGTIYEYIGTVLLERKSIWETGNEYCVKLFKRNKNAQEIEKFSSLRKCAKIVMLNALYSPANTKGLKAINDLRKEFPNLFMVLDAIKADRSEDFPIYLQRMEAKFILDNCSKRISMENPEMLLVSRHDSLSTTEDYAEVLYRKVQEMFSKYLGFDVKLQREPW